MLAIYALSFAQVKVIMNNDNDTREKLENVSNSLKERSLHLINLERNAQKAQELQTKKLARTHSYHDIIDNAKHFEEFNGINEDKNSETSDSFLKKLQKSWELERALLKNVFQKLDLRNATASERQEIHKLTDQILSGYTQPKYNEGVLISRYR